MHLISFYPCLVLVNYSFIWICFLAGFCIFFFFLRIPILQCEEFQKDHYEVYKQQEIT